MRRADITLVGQFEKRKNWKDALVDAVVATFLVRRVQDTEDASPMTGWEFLITERAKGAEIGQYQAHHGGFLKVTDTDIYAGAVREVREETGYELSYLTSVGPAIYRSELLFANGKIVLKISEEEAEPSVGFALPLFLADVTGKSPLAETDGEVRRAVWKTPVQIIDQFGVRNETESHSRFNYFQMLVPALLFLGGKWKPGQRAVLLPGEYAIDLS